MQSDNAGESELVLGTKQLLGLLFLSFVLLGIFFAMGYVLGRNSVPTESLRAADRERVQIPDGDSANTRPPATSGQVQANPAAEPEAAAVSSTRPAAPEEARRVEPVPAPEATPEPGNEPKPGDIFLQVSAVARPDAELLVDVLSRKGFRTAITPSPREGIYRVLVGPARTDAEVGKLRTDLEQAGFKSIPRRY